MSFKEIGNEGTTNSATPVTMVAAPRKAGVRRIIKGWTVYQPDATATLEVWIQVDKNGTDYVVWHEQNVAQFADFQVDQVVVLDATDEKLEIVLSGAPAATEWDWTVAFAEVEDVA